MKFLISCLLLANIQIGMVANEFKGKAQIDSVSKTGFYRIVLSPDIISEANESYSDIRIFDSKHKETPYLFREEEQMKKNMAFKEYPVIENKSLKKPAITRIVIHNDQKKNLSNFILMVRNSDIEKMITLKGSDDQKNWYIIKQDYAMSSSENNTETSEMKVFNFPKNNYEFFELTLNDKGKDPLQIIKVGYFDTEILQGKYTELPALSMTQVNKEKKSFITIRLKKKYEFSKLELNFSGPELFRRTIAIGQYIKQKNRTVFEEINSFIIDSNNPPILEFNKIKTDELVLIIDNEDNLPLAIQSVKAFQLNKYLISKLIRNESYEVFAGNKELQYPEYDLRYFTKNIENDIPVLGTGKVISINSEKPRPVSLFFNKKLMWVVIVLVIGLLSWYSFRLIKEMGSKS